MPAVVDAVPVVVGALPPVVVEPVVLVKVAAAVGVVGVAPAGVGGEPAAGGVPLPAVALFENSQTALSCQAFYYALHSRFSNAAFPLYIRRGEVVGEGGG